MGGLGSGRRWRTGSHETTDDYHRLSVLCWHRCGYLVPHRAFSWQWTRHGERVSSIDVETKPDSVIISYRHRRGAVEWQDGRSVVRVVWTPCHFGGQRPWFICPVESCSRRVVNLFAGPLFACRRCDRLTYQSQRETSGDRAARRADKIRDRLGWEPGILNGQSNKPKWMHGRTFVRLVRQHDNDADVSCADAERRFGICL